LSSRKQWVIANLSALQKTKSYPYALKLVAIAAQTGCLPGGGSEFFVNATEKLAGKYSTRLPVALARRLHLFRIAIRDDLKNRGTSAAKDYQNVSDKHNGRGLGERTLKSILWKMAI